MWRIRTFHPLRGEGHLLGECGSRRLATKSMHLPSPYVRYRNVNSYKFAKVINVYEDLCTSRNLSLSLNVSQFFSTSIGQVVNNGLFDALGPCVVLRRTCAYARVRATLSTHLHPENYRGRFNWDECYNGVGSFGIFRKTRSLGWVPANV